MSKDVFPFSTEGVIISKIYGTLIIKVDLNLYFKVFWCTKHKYAIKCCCS